MEDVDDPVNLMFVRANRVNILRHRNTMRANSRSTQGSQWELLRSANGLFN